MISKTQSITIATFYRFVPLAGLAELRERLMWVGNDLELRGTVLLASEGINGTVAGNNEAVDALFAFFDTYPALRDLTAKRSSHTDHAFEKWKVRIRPEIVTMGVDGVRPDQRTGTHVGVETWNELLADPDVVVIDTRNRYEISLGTFEGATDPETGSFREFPEYVAENLDPATNKRVAMFCTGGVRCEKASAFMLEQGFEEVYQLDGGILKYLEDVEPGQSRWRGDCFVFDDRVTVDRELQPSAKDICVNCRMPITAAARRSPLFEAEVSCPECAGAMTEERRSGLRERKRQAMLARSREMGR